MRKILLTLPLLLLLACSSAPSVPEDATYRVQATALSGDCGAQPARWVRIWRDAEGAHLRNVEASRGEACRLEASGAELAGSCPGVVGLEGDSTLAIYELGARLEGQAFVSYAGACSGRYALSGERL